MLIGPGTLYPAPSNIVLLCYCKQSAIACYKLHALCIFWKCTGLYITALYLLHCTALYHCVSLRCTALCLTNGALGQKVQQLWGCCNGLITSSSATTSSISSSASSEIQTNLKGNPPLTKMDEFPKTPNSLSLPPPPPSFRETKSQIFPEIPDQPFCLYYKKSATNSGIPISSFSRHSSIFVSGGFPLR